MGVGELRSPTPMSCPPSPPPYLAYPSAFRGEGEKGVRCKARFVAAYDGG
jgi:hypothetical protein